MTIECEEASPARIRGSRSATLLLVEGDLGRRATLPVALGTGYVVTTAATAEESAAASEELNAQAETSMDMVGQLEAMVGGAGAAPVGRAPRSTAKDRGRVLAMRQKPDKSKAPLPASNAEGTSAAGSTGTYGEF